MMFKYIVFSKKAEAVSVSLKVIMTVIIGGLVLSAFGMMMNGMVYKGVGKTFNPANDSEISSEETFAVSVGLGDVNKDGSVNSVDVSYLKYFYAGRNGYTVEIERGDLNGDGIIDNEDINKLETIVKDKE